MKYFILILIPLITLLACETPDPEAIVENETPAVLQDEQNSSWKDLSYDIKSSRTGDIVVRLFGEALKNNPDLQAHVDDMNETNYTIGDSIETVQIYLDNNTSYYSSVLNEQWGVIANISDSTKHHKYHEMFAAFDTAFQEKTKIYTSLIDSLYSQKDNLKDEFAILKLMTTHQMITNYQNNEIPSTDRVHSILKRYAALIQKTQLMTKEQIN